MAYEITAVATQLVEDNRNVLFTETPVPCQKGYVIHRAGSGLITLKGACQNQCRARYIVTFGGNIAVPTGGTVGEISLAITLNGEPLASTLMEVTPAAVEEYFNVSRTTFIDVPKGCCYTISVENTSGIDISVENASLVVERVA